MHSLPSPADVWAWRPGVNSATCCPSTGPEVQHEAAVPAGDGGAVQALRPAHLLQEAALLALLLPQRAAGEEEVPADGLEHRLRLQRLRL